MQLMDLNMQSSSTTAASHHHHHQQQQQYYHHNNYHHYYHHHHHHHQCHHHHYHRCLSSSWRASINVVDTTSTSLRTMEGEIVYVAKFNNNLSNNKQRLMKMSTTIIINAITINITIIFII